METTILGRTGIKVSVAGLGAGGASRLGLTRGLSAAQSGDLVRAAIDLGVTMIDTAPSYGTEAIVGEAIRGRRDGLVLSTKVRPNRADTAFDSTDYITASELRSSVEGSLSRLGTDRLDVVHVHGVRPHQYDHVRTTLLPALIELRREGKIRHLGMTEGFGVDREHTALTRAIEDGEWDVVMLGLNVINPSARRALLPKAIERGIGAMCMYAVRGALARPDSFQAAIDKLVAAGEIDRDDLLGIDPVKLLREASGDGSLTEPAYRYCRHTPGIHVVLFGTGDRQHLEDNIRAINRPALPAVIVAKLERLFRNVWSGNGDVRARR